jgi:hypothetical protein
MLLYLCCSIFAAASIWLLYQELTPTFPSFIEGFYNAPTTKALLLIVGGLSLFASVYQIKTSFHLQLVPHLTTHHQVPTFTHSTIFIYSLLGLCKVETHSSTSSLSLTSSGG